MRQYNITGMSCAACSARVEKAVSAVDGVSFCSVNLLTNSMSVEGADDASVIAAVRAAGYGASVKGAEDGEGDELDDAVRAERRGMILRLAFSLAFLLPLMYLSMGYVMWGAPLPQVMVKNPLTVALAELLLAATVMIINRNFFISGFKGAIKGAPNMDTLVALGSGASFIWSTFLVFKMCVREGVEAAAYLHEMYFESAAMILTLITVGKLLETIAKGKTTNAIKSLIKLTPKTATVIRDGVEVEILSKNVTRGDIFIVKPGESVAVDGVVILGRSAVDESALTGESIPREKAEGDEVFAATQNVSGYIKCRATKVGEDTTMARVVRLVSDAAATKAPIAKVADRVAKIFVPAVLLIALITTVVWLIVGQNVNNCLGYALERGISVLVISCPCALGLATPVAIMVGSGIGAKGGVLFKSATAIEELGRVKTVVLDKTGTLTVGAPRVTDVVSFGDEARLVSLAYSVESFSEHPLSRAIVEYATERSAAKVELENFRAIVGSGVRAELLGQDLVGVSYKYAAQSFELSPQAHSHYRRLADEGKTPLFFLLGGELLGIIAVADTLKDDAADSVVSLKKQGIRVVMLTGDNEVTANAIAKSIGDIEVVAGVMPDGKEAVIRELQSSGKVAMVGDGINDAPALVRADVGLAIGNGTDIAIESADVVLMHKTLKELPCAVHLSRATLGVIHENLFWAFIYNVIGIPLAAGALIPLGVTLNPMFSAAAMSISSFAVVMNALRLNLKRIFTKPTAADEKIDEKYEKTNNLTIKEQEKMEKVFRVEGMMCPHCEAHVKKAVEAIEGVSAAVASHKDGTVTVTLDGAVADEVIIGAITNEGYTVV